MAVSRRTFTASAAVGMAGLALPGLTGCQALSFLPKWPVPKALKPNPSYDVIVVGAGGAGLCAAIAAHDAGARVLVLEKTNKAGGNTNFTESGMNAAPTDVQLAAGISDSVEAFVNDTLVGGHNTGNVELVTYMCSQSASAIEWLVSIGILLDKVTTSAGMAVPRAHCPTNHAAIGTVLIPGLLSAVEARGIEIAYASVVKGLDCSNPGVCTGVLVAGSDGTDSDSDTQLYHARSVVLATGGMCSDLAMVKKYRPDLDGCVSTNQPASTGDGYRMAEQAQVALAHMDQIQFHPTVATDPASDNHPPTIIADGLRSAGAVLLNASGQRFYDETSPHDYVARALLNQPALGEASAHAWLVFDEAVRAANPAVESVYEPRGLVKSAPDISQLAQKMQLDAGAVQETLNVYFEVARGEHSDAFGRREGCVEFTGTLYAIRVGVGAHYQMGGIVINTASQALDANGTAIEGLYAAGEVTSGIHGRNRLAGNGVCDAVVFGRNAGIEAAAHASIVHAAGMSAGHGIAQVAKPGVEVANMSGLD